MSLSFSLYEIQDRFDFKKYYTAIPPKDWYTFAMKILLLLLIGSLTTPAKATKNLFPNDSLDGWHIVGPQIDFTIKDGVLIGEGKEGRNSFLTSKKSYGDFHLSVELKIIRGNSGIQVRSHDIDARLVGYQIEVDHSKRAWSGGLYDEGRRAWLQPPIEDVRDAFKLNEWNQYEIWCIGPRIKASVNGKVTTNFLDFMDLSGHIGFQVHSGDCKVMWRNATITEYTQYESKLKVESLFDGKTTNGMKPTGGGTWTVEDGVIVGRQSKNDNITGLMWITKPYENFAIKLKYKIDTGNSGFFFRSQQIPNDTTGIQGIQVEIDRQPDCGGLYESGGRGWLCKPTEQFSTYDQWNEMMVYTCGDGVMVWINNKLVVDCNTVNVLHPDKLADGEFLNNFAFQLHKRQEVEVRFKEIKIMVPKYIDKSGKEVDMFVGCGWLN